MKKLLAVLLALVMVFSFVACASEPAEEEAPAETEAGTEEAVGFKVASINWMNAHGWRSTYDAQLREVADEYKANGWITEYQEFCPNQDAALEVQYFEQCINDGYDIILINAGGSSGLDSCFASAEEAGILVVAVDNLYPYAGALGVQTDQNVWAGTNFDSMVKHFNGEPAKVIRFQGTLGTTGVSLREGIWLDGLEANPNFEVVYTGAHSWSDVESKKLMAEVIASGIEYDAILTEEACPGILAAIEDAGAPWPKWMSSDESVGYIRKLAEINKDEPVIDFQIIENPPGIGASALKVAVRVKQGKEFKADATSVNEAGLNVFYYTPSYTVTPDTLSEAIEKWKDAEDGDQMSTYLTEADADSYFA